MPSTSRRIALLTPMATITTHGPPASWRTARLMGGDAVELDLMRPADVASIPRRRRRILADHCKESAGQDSPLGRDAAAQRAVAVSDPLLCAHMPLSTEHSVDIELNEMLHVVKRQLGDQLPSSAALSSATLQRCCTMGLEHG